MARQKTIEITKRRVNVAKKGKPPKYKLQTTKKDIVKNTNVLKNNSSGGRSWSTDKAALESEKLSSDLQAKRTHEAQKTARVTAVATNVGAIASQALGRNNYTQNTAVEQIVNGGLQASQKGRDDDEDNGSSPWVD